MVYPPPVKPTEVLEQAIGTGVLMHRREGWAKPGAVIEHMSDERREALQKLTSEELSKVRLESWEIMGQRWEDQRNLSKRKLDFDRKCRVDPRP